MDFKSKIIKNGELLEQIWVILMFISIFNLNAFISLTYQKKFYIGNMISIIIIWVITSALGYLLFRYVWKKIRFSKIKVWVTNNNYLILVLLLSTIIRIPMLNTLPKWDAGEYYYRLGTACQNYDFTFSCFFENFRLCNHSNLGFSFFYAIAEFLFPRKQIGILSLNLIFTELAIMCIYLLLKEYWLDVEDKVVALITFVVSCTPIFLGTFAYFNVDYFLFIVFIFLVYFEYSQKNILMIFAAIVLSQTKETGVIIVATYLGSKMFVGFVQKKGNVLNRLRAILHKPYTWAAVLSGMLYIAEMKLIGSVTGWTQGADQESPMRWDSAGFNCFGYNLNYIIYKLKQLLILNFSWIICIIFIVSTVLLIIQRKRKYKNEHRLFYVIIVMVTFVIFSVLYITYTLPRYNILFNVLFTLFAVCLLYVVLEKVWDGKFYCFLMTILGTCFLIQSFWNIDIISSKYFETLSIGNGNSMIFSSYQNNYYGDGLVTNYQYAWIDKAIDKVLRNIHFNADILVIQPKEEYSVYAQGNLATYYLGWDSKNGKRIVEQDPGMIIQCRAPEALFTPFPYKVYDYNMLNSVRQRAVVIFIPYYELDEKETLRPLEKFYDIGQRKTLSKYGGEIVYYELLKKTSYRHLELENLSDDQLGINDNYSDNLFDGMKKQGWSKEKVREYYWYLLCQNAKVRKYKKEKSHIAMLDEVTMDVKIYSDDNQLIPSGQLGYYAGSYEKIIVGSNSMISAIDEMLIGCAVGDVVSCDWTVPTNYYSLPDYVGKTLHIEITPTAITGHINLDIVRDSKKRKIYKNAFNTVWNYYKQETLCSVVFATLDSNTFPYTELQKQRKKVKDYYYNLLYSAHISEKQFLEEYAMMSQDEFNTRKERMSRARCMWKYWKKKYYQQEKIIKENLYRSCLKQNEIE